MTRNPCWQLHLDLDWVSCSLSLRSFCRRQRLCMCTGRAEEDDKEEEEEEEEKEEG